MTRSGAIRGVVMVALLIVCASPLRVYAVSASVTDAYPGTTVPTGVRVSFIATGSGFSSRPTFKVVDSFPGGVTTANIDAAGNLAWTPNKDDIGSHTITITLTDQDGATADATMSITVVAAPSLSISDPSPAAAVAIGQTVSFSVTPSAFFSPTYTVSDPTPSSTAHGKSLLGTTFSWTPITQDVGTHQITVTAKDSFGSEASETVDITVLGPAKITTADLSPGTSVHANQPVTFSVSSDGFVDPWYGITDDFTGVSTSSIEIVGDLVSWTPQPNDFGVHVLRIGAHDDGGRAATTTLTITVTAPLPGSESPAATTPAVQSAPPAETNASESGTTNTAPPARPKTTKSTPVKTASTPLPTPTMAASTKTEQTGSTTLAYPTPVPLSDHIEVPDEVAPFPEIQPAPTFTEFLWQNVDAFFSMILGLFGH